jgi:NitT/TauT family transport system substrate-binding protein
MKKLILLFSVLLGLSLIMVGCGKSSSELTKVKLCEVTHSIFYAPQYVALTQGFFEEEGMEIELSNGQGADKVMTAKN